MAKRRQKRLRPAEIIVTDTVGRLAELWGFRRNLGRTWSVLYLIGRPMTAVELQQALGLSTGAVSMTLRELHKWGVIRRQWKPGGRQKLYIAEVDVWRVVSRMLRARELVELDGAVDKLERALAELRNELDETDDPKEHREVERKVKRTEGLLDLLRMLSSLLRVLTTTARLDASMLASYRLGGEEFDDDSRGGATP